MRARFFRRVRIALPSALVLLVALVAGCAHPISKDIRDNADKRLTFSELSRDPDAYKGRIVILSGLIISTDNLKDGTMMLVLQTPADSSGRPESVDQSQGRFFAMSENTLLDPAVWSKNREVTVAGEVLGARESMTGEMRQRLPLLRVLQIHIWEKRQPRYDPWYYDDGYYPYGLGGGPRFGVGVWQRL